MGRDAPHAHLATGTSGDAGITTRRRGRRGAPYCAGQGLRAITGAMAAKTKAKRKTSTKRTDKPTSAKLIAAAAKEFNQRGFDGTDTNRIARRAGFAPQTFYRWFRDKTEIFLAVYRAWDEEERGLLDKLLSRNAAASE